MKSAAMARSMYRASFNQPPLLSAPNLMQRAKRLASIVNMRRYATKQMRGK